MDRAVTTGKMTKAMALRFSVALIFLTLCFVGTTRGDDLEDRCAECEKAISEMLQQYRQASTNNDAKGQDALEQRIKPAIRESLKLGDELRLERIERARAQLDRLEERLKAGKSRLDSRAESEWNRRSVAALSISLGGGLGPGVSDGASGMPVTGVPITMPNPPHRPQLAYAPSAAEPAAEPSLGSVSIPSVDGRRSRRPCKSSR